MKRGGETGRDFVRWLRPAGCVLVLAISIVTLIICFTAKGSPVKGYNAPNGSSYYSSRPEELAAELNAGLFPKLGRSARAAAESGKVAVTAAAADLPAVKSAVIHYYDESLFDFRSDG